MQRRNRIKEAIQAGRKARGIHMTFAQPAAIEVLAPFNLDFVYIDGEHGCFDWRDIETACIVAERHAITPIARVPDPTAPTITRFLDRGVTGLVVPHIDLLADAAAVVEAAFYAPVGNRSFGGGRPFFGAGIKDLAGANAALSLGIMVESRGALADAAAIAALPAVDYLSFGMNDLAQSLGHAGEPTHPDVQAAVADASARIRAAGKPVREDCMTYAWINDILTAGARVLLDG